MTAAGRALAEHETAATRARAAAEREAAEQALRDEQDAAARRAFSVQVHANTERMIADSPLADWFPGSTWQTQFYDNATSSWLHGHGIPSFADQLPREAIITDTAEPGRMLLELSRTDHGVQVRVVERLTDRDTGYPYYSGPVIHSAADAGRFLAALEARHPTNPDRSRT